MKTMKRNQQPFYYCLFKGEIPAVDENGNKTGETIVTYHPPVLMRANISEATGFSNTEQFGNLKDYDKVIVTERIDCPIDENTVLFIDKLPKYTTIITHNVVESNALYGTEQINEYNVVEVAPDYIVKRVSRSLNSVSIAVKKVVTS